MAFPLTELRLNISFPTAASVLYLLSCSTYLKPLSHRGKGCCVEEEAVYDSRGYLCGLEGEWLCLGQLLVALGLPDALLLGTTGAITELLLFLCSLQHLTSLCMEVGSTKQIPARKA